MLLLHRILYAKKLKLVKLAMVVIKKIYYYDFPFHLFKGLIAVFSELCIKNMWNIFKSLFINSYNVF